MDRSGPLTIWAAGRPGTGTAPVSIRAIPTPLPGQPAAAGLVAPIAAATSVTLFPFPDAHWVAENGEVGVRAGVDPATAPGTPSTLPTTAEAATTDVTSPRFRSTDGIKNLPDEYAVTRPSASTTARPSLPARFRRKTLAGSGRRRRTSTERPTDGCHRQEPDSYVAVATRAVTVVLESRQAIDELMTLARP